MPVAVKSLTIRFDHFRGIDAVPRCDFGRFHSEHDVLLMSLMGEEHKGFHTGGSRMGIGPPLKRLSGQVVTLRTPLCGSDHLKAQQARVVAEKPSAGRIAVPRCTCEIRLKSFLHIVVRRDMFLEKSSIIKTPSSHGLKNPLRGRRFVRASSTRIPN